jgi:hypothetical protein
MTNLKTIALAGSMIGSVLIASTLPIYRVAAGLIWLIANTIWLSYSMKAKDRHQSYLWTFYNITCLITIFNNIYLIG